MPEEEEQNHPPVTISGYTTTRNCVEMDYPFEESILSMLEFCDEVVVLDSSDKDDGTIERLTDLAEKDGRITVMHVDIDWKAPNHGVYDGMTKGMAREKCTGDFLWQFDVDEVMHEDDAPKVRQILRKVGYLSPTPLMALPVIEYWGSEGKVRIDVNPWKWRLSRNIPDITHGIPAHLRKMENGLLYANHGTDSCDYISKTTGAPIPFVNFVPDQLTQIRMAAIHNEKVAPIYEQWLNKTINDLPGVFHYSWYSIERKIKQYRLFWTSFWKALYNEDRDPNWNPFFDVSWEQVTDEMIKAKARELEEKTGGWIFHNKWDGSSTNYVRVNREQPKIMKDWIERHRRVSL